LKSYLLLAEISDKEDFIRNKYLKFRALLVSISITIFICLSIFLILYINKATEYQVSVSKNKELSESISSLKNELAIKPYDAPQN
jgi:hypothetical protein